MVMHQWTLEGGLVRQCMVCGLAWQEDGRGRTTVIHEPDEDLEVTE